MEDNILFTGLLIFATVLAIVGLVLVFLQKKGTVKSFTTVTLVFLQKKGTVKSFTTVTQSGPDYISVGKAFIVPVFLGVLLLYRYSLLWAVLYGVIFIAAYILIQVLVK